MALHVGGHSEPLLTSSLLLFEASPEFLGRLLINQNHCDGCNSRKSIVLADEKEDTIISLLDQLHAKFLKQPARPLESSKKGEIFKFQ